MIFSESGSGMIFSESGSGMTFSESGSGSGKKVSDPTGSGSATLLLVPGNRRTSSLALASFLASSCILAAASRLSWPNE
jgi:hypothetical protein